MTLLTRYWFEFERDENFRSTGVQIGVGVTAYSLDDAEYLIRSELIGSASLPKIKRIVENVDIRDLDQGHVRPNMDECHTRCIWYPLGYKTF